MTSTIVPPDKPIRARRIIDCGADDVPIALLGQFDPPVTGHGDPTPVDDLEAYYQDPVEADVFERRLTAAFGIDADGREVGAA